MTWFIWKSNWQHDKIIHGGISATCIKVYADAILMISPNENSSILIILILKNSAQIEKCRISEKCYKIIYYFTRFLFIIEWKEKFPSNQVFRFKALFIDNPYFLGTYNL